MGVHAASFPIACALALTLAACSQGTRSVPRIHSAATLSSPPSVVSVNEYDGLSYCVQSSTAVVAFFSDGDPTLTVPGSGNLSSMIVERGSTKYLVVASFDSNDRARLYRYHDADEDGIPDESTELELLDLGPTPAYITSVSLLSDGTTYLLDARCQDILVATDTDNDTWPDTVSSTPFAMSSAFGDLLEVRAIRAMSVGDVRGAISYSSQSELLTRGQSALVSRFQDTNADGVADSGGFELPQFATLRVFGVPAAGHQQIWVKATAGHTVTAFALDAQYVPTTQLGSVVVQNQEWTSMSLSRALVHDEWIVVSLATEPGSGVRSRVWTARAQIVETEPTVVDIGGGTIEVRGLNLDENMEVTLVTADDVVRELSFEIEDERTATVTIPALPAAAEGPAYLIITDPDEPEAPTAVEVHINDLTSGS